MWRYSVEPRTRKYVKGNGFFIICKKIYKTVIGCKNRFFKNCFKAGEFLGYKIADTVIKSNNTKIVKPNENSENVGKIIISLK